MGYTKNEWLKRVEREKYNNACIYSIMTGGGFYVGSTRNFKKRKTNHTSCIKNINNQIPLYKKIRENNGVWIMHKLKDYPCANGEELRKEEQFWIDEFSPNLNPNRAFALRN